MSFHISEPYNQFFFLGGGSFIIFDIIYGINDKILDDFELLM